MIEHVTDGDTVALRNGQRVRLVQFDTPEVYFGTEYEGKMIDEATRKLAEKLAAAGRAAGLAPPT